MSEEYDKERNLMAKAGGSSEPVLVDMSANNENSPSLEDQLMAEEPQDDEKRRSKLKLAKKKSKRSSKRFLASQMMQPSSDDDVDAMPQMMLVTEFDPGSQMITSTNVGCVNTKMAADVQSEYYTEISSGCFSKLKIPIQKLLHRYDAKLEGHVGRAVVSILELLTPQNAHLAYEDLGELHRISESYFTSSMKWLFDKIDELYPIKVPLEDCNGESFFLERYKVETNLQKITLQPDETLKLIQVQVPFSKEEMESLMDEEMESLMDGEVCEADKLLRLEKVRLIEMCCLLGHRTMFLKMLTSCGWKGNEVTDLMAEDIYDLLHHLNCFDPHRQQFFPRMEAIAVHFEDSDWREGITMPLLQVEKSTEPDGPDIIVRYEFLNRKLVTSKLETMLCSYSRVDVIEHFLEAYPKHVVEFLSNEKSLRDCKDQKLLRELVKVGVLFQYDQLYFEAYAALFELDPTEKRTLYPLHCHYFTREEVLEIVDSKSPFITLVAGDKSRAKIHQDTLKTSSDYFKNILGDIGMDVREYECKQCVNIGVLRTWIRFMADSAVVTNEKQVRIKFPQNVSAAKGDRILVALMHVADFFQVKGMLLKIVNELGDRVNEDNAMMIYHQLPAAEVIADERVKEAILSVNDKLERYYRGNITQTVCFERSTYDDNVKSVGMLQRILTKMVETDNEDDSDDDDSDEGGEEEISEEEEEVEEEDHEQVNVVGDRRLEYMKKLKLDLYGNEDEVGVENGNAKHVFLMKSRKDLAKITGNIEDLDFGFIKSVLNERGYDFRFLEEMLHGMKELDSQVEVQENNISIPLVSAKITFCSLFQKDDSWKLILSVVTDTDECLKRVSNLTVSIEPYKINCYKRFLLICRKVVILNELENIGLVFDLDTSAVCALATPPKKGVGGKFQYKLYDDNLLAILPPHEESTQIFKYETENNSWSRFLISENGLPLQGKTITVEDRLYFIDRDDWVRYLVPHKDPLQNYQYDIFGHEIRPYSHNMHFGPIIGTVSTESEILIFHESVVVLLKKDTFEFVEERKLPFMQKETAKWALVVAGKFLLVYFDFFTYFYNVYEYDLLTGNFSKIIELKDESNLGYGHNFVLETMPQKIQQRQKNRNGGKAPPVEESFLDNLLDKFCKFLKLK